MSPRRRTRHISAIVRLVVSGFFVATWMLSAGPLLAMESLKLCESPTSLEDSTEESKLLGAETRLVQVRRFWSPRRHPQLTRLPAASHPTPSRVLPGHYLSHELRAPLRC